MLTISQLSLSFGERDLFTDVNLQMTPSHRYGIVGANGTGKTTFLKILSKDEKNFQGKIDYPSQTRIGVLQQDHFRFENEEIIHVVLMGRPRLWQALEERENLLALSDLSEKDSLRLADLEIILDQEEGYTAESEAAQILDGLGIQTHQHKQPLSILSGGFKLRVLLAQLLFSQPDILLLDEPTNHLDIYSIKWLEDYLKNFRGVLAVVSHDREFLNNVSTHILDVDYQMIRSYTGNYEQFLSQKSLEREQKEQALANQEKRKAEIQAFVNRFRSKASKAKQVQSRIKMLEKMEEIKLPPSSRKAPILKFPIHTKANLIPLKVKDISKAYADNTVLSNITFDVERGERIALIGPNGIGKSTLLKILVKDVDSDQGDFEWGNTIEVGYFPQEPHQVLEAEATLYEWLARFDDQASIGRVRQNLAFVLFNEDQVDHKISTLSGGEASRLILAKLMITHHNTLILDEPTNHLDVEAIDELALALQQYPGTIIFVSHNRYFVSQVATRILEIRQGHIMDFKGSYAEYLEKEGTDHLTTDVNWRKRQQSEKGELAASPPQQPSVAELSYEERKSLKRKHKQLKTRAEDLENMCQSLEKKILIADNKMADYEWFKEQSEEKQQQIVKDSQKFREELENTFEIWESTSMELEEVTITLGDVS